MSEQQPLLQPPRKATLSEVLYELGIVLIEYLFVFYVFCVPFWLCWNFVMPVFGVPTLTYLQCSALLTLPSVMVRLCR